MASRVSHLTARTWLDRFREQYDAAAGSQFTELGLFYERHRKFIQYQRMSDPDHPEYSDAEWDRVMGSFLLGLAREFGLVQAPGGQGQHELSWFWPGVPQAPAATIRAANNATDSILTEDLPQVVRSGAELSVLVMYPDYPHPPGTDSIDDATTAWRSRVESELLRLGLDRGFLLLTISAYAWDVPAPWKGFVWNPQLGVLEGPS
jgi:hypothetical protein